MSKNLSKELGKDLRKSERKKTRTSRYIHESEKQEKKTIRKKKKKKIVDEREKNVNNLSKILEDFISEIIMDNDNLSQKKETIQSIGLKKQFKQGIKLVDNVKTMFDSTYMIASSSTEEVYTIKLGLSENEKQFVCTCGDKYGDFNRANCKHTFAVLFYHFKFMSKSYLNKYADIFEYDYENMNNILEKMNV